MGFYRIFRVIDAKNGFRVNRSSFFLVDTSFWIYFSTTLHDLVKTKSD